MTLLSWHLHYWWPFIEYLLLITFIIYIFCWHYIIDIAEVIAFALSQHTPLAADSCGQAADYAELSPEPADAVSHFRFSLFSIFVSFRLLFAFSWRFQLSPFISPRFAFAAFSHCLSSAFFHISIAFFTSISFRLGWYFISLTLITFRHSIFTLLRHCYCLDYWYCHWLHDALRHFSITLFIIAWYCHYFHWHWLLRQISLLYFHCRLIAYFRYYCHYITFSLITLAITTIFITPYYYAYMIIL